MNFFTSILLVLFIGSCRATEKDGFLPMDVISESDSASRQIFDSVICEIQHQKIEMTPGNGSQMYVKNKQLKELHCEIDSTTNVTGKDIKWSFRKEACDELMMEKLGLVRYDRKWTSILVIQEMEVHNEGKYTCQVGDINKSVNVKTLPDSGLVYVYPKRVEVKKGADVEFHCRVEGIKGVINRHLKWFHVSNNGTKTSLPNSRWKVENPCITSQTSYITIKEAKLEDNGRYICVAPNGKQSTGLLIIKESSKCEAIATPSKMNVYKNQKLEFDCFTRYKNGKPAGKPEVRFPNGTDVSTNPAFKITNIGPSRIRIKLPHGLDIPENQLNMTCGCKDSEAPVTIRVSPTCKNNERSCHNGQCIDSSKFCDHIEDCEDGSDEIPSQCEVCDPRNILCGPVNGIANSKKQYFSANRLCDGENDCANGFDEINCSSHNTTCDFQFFTCKNKLNIPKSFVCDGSDDCPTGEDELNCLRPDIRTVKDKKVQAKPGSTVKLECVAEGYPLPGVVWRYNWGCLIQEDRIYVKETRTNCKISSVLTIENFKAGDDAIYSCEAITDSNRANVDYFVSMA